MKYGLMHRDGASPGFNIDPDTGDPFSTCCIKAEYKCFCLSVGACFSGILTGYCYNSA